MTYKLPPLPETDYMMGGKGYSGSQLQAYAIAAIEAQGVPDGLALQIEAAVTQAQKVLSAWNEWYGMHGKNAPIPPAGIVNAQDLLAVARSLLASAPPAPQAKPQPLSGEQETILNFLLGASDMDGVWFGDKHPQHRGQFWWRDHLRKAFQQPAHGITKE